MPVHLQNVQVVFICQGHWVKVKVTGAKKQDVCTKYTFAGGPPSIERQSSLD